VYGDFVDGGVSPFNNPAFQALLYATASGYRVEWPTGEDKLLVVSVGTGAHDPAVPVDALPAGTSETKKTRRRRPTPRATGKHPSPLAGQPPDERVRGL